MQIRAGRFVVAAVLLGASACAGLSPASRIESRLIDLGMSHRGAECLAGELAENLNRSELRQVAEFLDGFDRRRSTGGAVDALRSFDEPHVAATVAAAAIFCAITG